MSDDDKPTPMEVAMLMERLAKSPEKFKAVIDDLAAKGEWTAVERLTARFKGLFDGIETELSNKH